MAFGRAGGRVYCTNSLGYDKDSRVYPPLPRIRPGGGGGGQKREMGGVGRRTRCTKMKESRKEGGGREREGGAQRGQRGGELFEKSVVWMFSR